MNTNPTRGTNGRPSTEAVLADATGTIEERAIVIRDSDTILTPGDFGPEHMRIVREAFASGASEAEFRVLWAGARARGLDPIRKQIHFVKRWDNAKEREVWSSQVSIDGFRSIAESTGQYDGQDEPQYEYSADGTLVLARVKVYRKDISRPFVGVARWDEYVQTTRKGEPSYMWKKMEHTMLSKCAEALALRKAFPERLAGLYTGEEMAQADSVAPPVRTTEIEKPYAEPHRDATPSPPPHPTWALPIFSAPKLKDAVAVAVETALAYPEDAEHPGRVLEVLREHMRAKGVGQEAQASAIVGWRKGVAARQARAPDVVTLPAGAEETREPGVEG